MQQLILIGVRCTWPLGEWPRLGPIARPRDAFREQLLPNGRPNAPSIPPLQSPRPATDISERVWKNYYNGTSIKRPLNTEFLSLWHVDVPPKMVCPKVDVITRFHCITACLHCICTLRLFASQVWSMYCVKRSDCILAFIIGSHCTPKKQQQLLGVQNWLITLSAKLHLANLAN